MPPGSIAVGLLFIVIIIGSVFANQSLLDTLKEFAKGFDRDWPVKKSIYFKEISGRYRGQPISASIRSDRSGQFFSIYITAKPALQIQLVDKRSRITGYGPPIWLLRDEFPKPLMIKHDCEAALDAWLTKHDALFRSFIAQFNLTCLECKPDQISLHFDGFPKTANLPLLWQMIAALLEPSEGDPA